MDICALRDELFGRGVTEAALKIDPEGVRTLEERYQENFDNNKSYLGINVFFPDCAEQGSDTEEEAQAIADQLQLDLECLVHDHWLSSLTRDEVISLCKKLKKTSQTYILCQGAEYTADQIIFDWSEIFPAFAISPKEII